MVAGAGRAELDAQIAQMAQVSEYKAAEAARRAEVAAEDARRASRDAAGISEDRYIRSLATPEQWRQIEFEAAHRAKALPADDAGLY